MVGNAASISDTLRANIYHPWIVNITKSCTIDNVITVNHLYYRSTSAYIILHPTLKANM